MEYKDRRVRKTNKVLKESLATLLQQKELNSISVSELTALADLSRSTFYAHYMDLYDLYEQMENDLLEDIDRIMQKDPKHEYYDLYETLINYIYENAVIFKSFIGNSKNSQFRNKLADFIEKKYNQIVMYETNATNTNESWKYIIRYLNGGFIHLISLWLENDLSYPKEAIIKLAIDLDYAADPIYDLYE